MITAHVHFPRRATPPSCLYLSEGIASQRSSSRPEYQSRCGDSGSMQNGGLKISGGAVNIVVIIAVNQARTNAAIEKWEIARGGGGRPVTRAITNSPIVPVSTHKITVSRNRNTGSAYHRWGASGFGVCQHFPPPCRATRN